MAELELTWKPVGKGRIALSFKNGEAIHSDELNIRKASERKQFVDAICNARPAIDRAALEQELNRIASESMNRRRMPSSDRVALSPKTPMETARAFLLARFTQDNTRTLQNYVGCFVAWRDGAHREIESAGLRKQVYEFCEGADDAEDGGPFKPTKTRVDSIIDALAALCHLPGDITPPHWLDGRKDSARDIVPMRNGILNIVTSKLAPLTPLLFTTCALPFDYNADAPAPCYWLEFLLQLFGSDEESIQLLAEWFGYCLSWDTSQQKILLLLGPKRSGKGTIARVLAALLGLVNVAGPTLASLASPFGLQPLVGKLLAIISDARLGSGIDSAAIVERLLAVSGEDLLSVPRKYSTDVHMKLSTRIMFLSNELPRLNDASGALANRFLVLKLTRSFFGEEDTTLTDRLVAELPSILRWAIQGRQRLVTLGHFHQPEHSRQIITDLEDLASPVNAFVRDYCTLKPGASVLCSELYEAWGNWCRDQGWQHITTIYVFGRDLAATCSTVSTTQRRTDSGRSRYYIGIELRPYLSRDGTRVSLLYAGGK